MQVQTTVIIWFLVIRCIPTLPSRTSHETNLYCEYITCRVRGKSWHGWSVRSKRSEVLKTGSHFNPGRALGCPGIFIVSVPSEGNKNQTLLCTYFHTTNVPAVSCGNEHPDTDSPVTMIRECLAPLLTQIGHMVRSLIAQLPDLLLAGTERCIHAGMLSSGVRRKITISLQSPLR